MKKILIESGEPVTDLNIVLVARDCAKSLPSTLALFEVWEDNYDCNFHFVFVENGSKDNTRSMLESFAKDRTAVLATPELATIIESMPRVMRISEARNKARELVDQKAKWTVMIDSDIYCNPQVLEKIFAHNPGTQNIAMLCAFGTQIMFDEGKMLHSTHYYDTFAFTSLQHNGAGSSHIALHYPLCIFEGCKGCEKLAKNFRKRGLQVADRVPRQGLVDVASAFGGMAIIDTASLLHSDVKWSSRHEPMLSPDGSYTCEHIDFCRTLSHTSGKRVAVATDCEVYWDGGTRISIMPEAAKQPLVAGVAR